ncbi:hypothetical protein HYS30_02325 [Candidatus Peregrinibacteria bacterium]|nr:hypothetical protein [Candidatus Peregrinibacteria bacterium]
MLTELRWYCVLGFCCLTLAVLMQAPQWRHRSDARFRGVPVQLNADEYYYLPRVMEALRGRISQASEGIVGDRRIRSLQGAIIEQTYGILFGWTGWRAATVLQIMDSIEPPLLFLALIAFLTIAGFSRVQALAGSVLFVLLELYSLNRPVHQRASFFLVLLTCTLLLVGVRGRRIAAVAGGVLLGLLVGVYFWSYTFAWAFWLVLLLWECGIWLQNRSRKPTAIIALLLSGGIGVAIALPFFLHTYTLSQDPFFPEVQFRNEVVHSRLPESWLRSGLFLIMAASALFGGLSRARNSPLHRNATAVVLAAFLVLNQQALHGTVLIFSSHYLFPLVFAGVVALLLFWKLRSRWMVPGILASAVFLAGIAYDGRAVLSQWRVLPGRFEDQHLSTLLPLLDTLPRSRILSETHTSLFVAGQSQHDVVYSPYLKHTLMSNRQFTERYCLTVLPRSPRNHESEDLSHLQQVFPASAISPSERNQKLRDIQEICAKVAEDPRSFLLRYGVTYILWNEQRELKWDLKRLHVPLEKVGQGEGWSLWKMR